MGGPTTAGGAGGPAPLEVEVRPPSPFRLGRGTADRTLRVQGGVATRLLSVDRAPVLARAWMPGPGRVAFRAEAVDPAALVLPAAGEEPRPAGPAELATAIERLRFALGVDEDLSAFHHRFRRDPLVGPLIRRRPAFRPRRRPWPWEALAQAVCGQLIEASRAAVIERRIVGRWGARLGEGRGALRDTPPAVLIAGRAPAELEAMDLSGGRSVALRKLAAEVARGRCDPGSPDSDPRLLAVPGIGAWTIQCLALRGRGDPDALPAGDLGYIKLVGLLANLGRRATVPEVEEFYAPYEPYRGLVGSLTLTGLQRMVAEGPRLPWRVAALRAGAGVRRGRVGVGGLAGAVDAVEVTAALGQARAEQLADPLLGGGGAAQGRRGLRGRAPGEGRADRVRLGVEVGEIVGTLRVAGGQLGLGEFRQAHVGRKARGRAVVPGAHACAPAAPSVGRPSVAGGGASAIVAHASRRSASSRATRSIRFGSRFSCAARSSRLLNM